MMVGLPPFYHRDVQEMYQKILYSELKFPDYISEDAKDLLRKVFF
jgi:hypothetical protein